MIRLAFMLVAIIVTLPAHAFDIKNISVAGVKLGMSREQVLSALTSTLRVEPNQILLGPKLKCPITGRMLSQTMELQVGDLKYFVGFELDDPGTPNPNLVASFITEESSYPRSIEQVSRRFGEPSDTSMVDANGPALWCNQPIDNQCQWTSPLLSFDGKKLQLEDPRYLEKRQAALEKL
ncbi:TPA: hypothetical protein SLU87_002931 [Pseudomonas aeruginosa]|nr:hypothetical protein [Pseudomonas aeruginosa]